jgi:DNA gyrase subunit A
MMAIRSGKAIRFPESLVRPMGRNASGVRGVRLANDEDELVGMVCVEEGDNNDILVVSEKGYGKRSAVEDYRTTNRGGKGVKTLNITDKTGKLASIKAVNDEDDLIIINKSGVLIRLEVKSLRVMGRATQGVKLINIKDSDSIASVTKVPAMEEEEIEAIEGELETNDENPPATEEGSTDID